MTNDQTINDTSVNEGGGLQLTEVIGDAISVNKRGGLRVLQLTEVVENRIRQGLQLTDNETINKRTINEGGGLQLTEVIGNRDNDTDLAITKQQSEIVGLVNAVLLAPIFAVVLSAAVNTRDTLNTSAVYARARTETIGTVVTATTAPSKINNFIIGGIQNTRLTPTKLLSGNISTADAVNLFATKQVSIIISITDTIIYNITRSVILTEVLNIIDTFERTFMAFVQPIEVITSADTNQLTTSKLNTEAVSIFGSTNLEPDLALLEQFAGIENVSEVGVVKQLSETVTIIDTIIAREIAITQAITETVGFVHHTNSRVSKQVLQTARIIHNEITRVKKVQSKQITVTEQITILPQYVLSLTENIDIRDEITRNRKRLAELTEIVGIITKRRTRISTQIFNTSGIVNRSLFNTAKLKTEIITITANIAVLKILIVSMQQTVAIVDTRKSKIHKSCSEIESIQPAVLFRVQKTIAEIVRIIGDVVPSKLLKGDLIDFTVSKTQPERITTRNQIALTQRKILSTTVAILAVRVGSRFSIQRLVGTFGVVVARQHRVRKPVVSSVNSLATIRRVTTSILDDTVGIIDATVQNYSIIRSLTVVIAIRDSAVLSSTKVIAAVGGSVGTPTGKPITQLAETAGIIAQFDTIINIRTILTETVVVVDEFATIGDFIRIFTETVRIHEKSIRSIKMVVSESLAIVTTVFGDNLNFFTARIAEVVSITEETTIAVKKQIVTVVIIKTEFETLKTIFLGLEEVVTTVDQITIVKRVFQFTGLERVTNIAQYKEVGEFAESVKSLIDMETKVEDKED